MPSAKIDPSRLGDFSSGIQIPVCLIHFSVPFPLSYIRYRQNQIKKILESLTGENFTARFLAQGLLMPLPLHRGVFLFTPYEGDNPRGGGGGLKTIGTPYNNWPVY
jgi:hypothetical protein